MPLSGIISRQPPIQMTDWLNCMGRHQELVKPAPREIVNPFTGLPHLHVPGVGEAEIWIDGRIVGGFAPSETFEDDAELEVFTPEGQPTQEVRDIASTLAAELGATLEWFGDD